MVITMDAATPARSIRQQEDWVLDDLAGKGVDAVRPIRDEIRRRVEALLDDLIPARTN